MQTHANSSPIYTGSEIRTNPQLLNTDWEAKAFKDLSLLLEPASPQEKSGFPCLLGMIAFSKKYMKVSFYEALDDENSLYSLAENLEKFAKEISEPRDIEKQKYETFISIFRMGSINSNIKVFSQASNLLWGVLQNLNKHDTIDWPIDAVKNVHDTKFQFRYSGVRFFPLFFSPLHEYAARRTNNFMILFQPTNIFDYHREHTKHFKKIQAETHARIERFTGEAAQFYTLDHGTVYETMQYLGEHQKNIKVEEWFCPLVIK